MNGKFRLYALIIITAMIFCSCKPAGKKAVAKYAKENFGEGTFVKTEEISDDEIIYYFEDKEYGFEYYVKSKVNSILIDGAKFGETEGKSSDFATVYYEYVTSCIKSNLDLLENEYGVDIITDSESLNQGTFAKIYYTTGNTGTASVIAEKVTNLYKGYDSRNYWKNSQTKVYDTTDNLLGKYDVSYNMWMTPELESQYFFLEIAKDMNSKAEYVRTEEKLFKDTGILLGDIQIIAGNEKPTDNSIITYYYFKAGKKEFFIADVRLNTTDSWHTNYDGD